jgi:hypothetical protein
MQKATMEQNEAYKKMQQRSDTRNSREEYQGKRDEKRIHRKKKREWMKAQVENMELLNNQNESRKFYREVNT